MMAACLGMVWGEAVHGLGTARGAPAERAGLGITRPRRPQARRSLRGGAELGGKALVHIPTGPMTVTGFSYPLIA